MGIADIPAHPDESTIDSRQEGGETREERGEREHSRAGRQIQFSRHERGVWLVIFQKVKRPRQIDGACPLLEDVGKGVTPSALYQHLHK